MKKTSLMIALLLVAFFTKAQTIPGWKISDVVNHYSKKTDSVYVVNFWATFCKPCIAEIPYLQTISKKYEGQKVKLLLVSLDLPSFYPGKIQSFAKKNNFAAKIVWLNETDADHFCPLIDKKWSGSIPATIFVNPATGYKNFVESEMSEAEFERELKLAIGEVR
ncbi:MAG: TlpA family protein disulfide reductase [Ferruginibacter sp.]|nr:TlpA family protein disulfide reductase [Ferruginibacter sp.]